MALARQIRLSSIKKFSLPPATGRDRAVLIFKALEESPRRTGKQVRRKGALRRVSSGHFRCPSASPVPYTRQENSAGGADHDRKLQIFS